MEKRVRDLLRKIRHARRKIQIRFCDHLFVVVPAPPKDPEEIYCVRCTARRSLK